MSNIKKRLFALLMTVVMALGLSATAFAAEPVDITQSPTAVASEEASTRAAGDVIGSASTTIYGGSGFLYVTLPTWNFFADFQAGIDRTSQNGLVTCSVVTPDGKDVYLGVISGSGSRTSLAEIAYAPSGTYAFYFSSADTEPFDVCGFIYD